jgi:sulfotransferase family protein
MPDNSALMGVRAIFVLGSPRSGTTMLGNYIGSARSVLNTGEYRALYLVYGALPIQLHGALTGLVPAAWEPHRLDYMRQAQKHAVDFVVRAAEEAGCTAFCDSTPRNVFITAQLAEIFPDALFVLSLRHYSGVIQSLLRLGMMTMLPGNERSMDWVEPNAVAAAIYWARHYQAALTAPMERTAVFGYDAFCADPTSVLARFKASLSSAGFPTEELDDRTFSVSHATPEGQSRTTVGGDSGLKSIPSYDAASWSEAMERDVRPFVREIDEALGALFPHDYRAPSGYPDPDPRS